MNHLMNKWIGAVMVVLCALIGVGCRGEAAPSTFAAQPSSTAVPTSTPQSPTAESIRMVLHDLGRAPEIFNDTWLNTDAPITLASVQGKKAVLIEFWTFG